MTPPICRWMFWSYRIRIYELDRPPSTLRTKQQSLPTQTQHTYAIPYQPNHHHHHFEKCDVIIAWALIDVLKYLNILYIIIASLRCGTFWMLLSHLFNTSHVLHSWYDELWDICCLVPVLFRWTVFLYAFRNGMISYIVYR